MVRGDAVVVDGLAQVSECERASMSSVPRASRVAHVALVLTRALYSVAHLTQPRGGVDGRVGLADLGRTPLLAGAVEVALVRASEPLAVAAVPARVAPAALTVDAHAVVGAGAVLVLDVGIVRAVDAARRVDRGPGGERAPEGIACGAIGLGSGLGLGLGSGLEWGCQGWGSGSKGLPARSNCIGTRQVSPSGICDAIA